MTVEHRIGNVVNVKFPTFNNKEIEGKVDTGATVTSLHATDIKMSPDGKYVMFSCPCLSDNFIKMKCAATQEVSSADSDGKVRPVVIMDIIVDNIQMQVELNLNDRSNMDYPVLIGQNVLKRGQFIIDISQNPVSESVNEDVDTYNDDFEKLAVQLQELSKKASDMARKASELCQKKKNKK